MADENEERIQEQFQEIMEGVEDPEAVEELRNQMLDSLYASRDRYWHLYNLSTNRSWRGEIDEIVFTEWTHVDQVQHYVYRGHPRTGFISELNEGDRFYFKTELEIAGVHHKRRDRVDMVTITENNNQVQVVLSLIVYPPDKIYPEREDDDHPRDLEYIGEEYVYNQALRNTRDRDRLVQVFCAEKARASDSNDLGVRKRCVYVYRGLYEVREDYVGVDEKIRFGLERI